MFFRQGYGAGVLPPTPRACAPPTVAEDKKFHAGHGRRVPKKEKATSFMFSLSLSLFLGLLSLALSLSLSLSLLQCTLRASMTTQRTSCQQATHTSPKTLDPTLSWCIKHRHLFHPLEDFQNAVISDIQDLVFEMQEHTMAWFNILPEHVQRAYRHKDSVTQIPVLIHLLRSIQYPQTELIYRELSEGFPLMGKLTPGINWHVRQDQKYLEPTPIDEFREKNRT